MTSNSRATGNRILNPISPIAHIYVTSEVHAAVLWHIGYVCDIGPWNFAMEMVKLNRDVG